METAVLLTVLIFAAAVLYSSVGHAGASGYLAAMALVGVAPEVMKPTALALNILVATIATVKYYRAGYFYWSALWPFAIGSIPLSFVGGAIILPGYLYKPAVGIVLLYAAYRLFRATMGGHQERDRKSTRLNSSHANISYAVFCLKKKKLRNTCIQLSTSKLNNPLIVLSSTVVYDLVFQPLY